MASLPSGTVTFLFTDVERSTGLLQRLQNRYADALAEHHQLLRTIFEQAGGQGVRIHGDGFFVAFPRARDAIAAAVAAQRALAGHPWPDRQKLRVRIGVHTGEPLIAETGYVGIDVHSAARIRDVGHGGQILLSEATRRLVEDELPEGISLRDLGEHRLRDLARPQRLYQVVIPELPSEFPPLTSLEWLPNNLPVQLTSFVGRDRERAEVKRLLGATRLLTLTGPGGAGKTRLALQVGAEVLEEFPDGVWLVELTAVFDANLLPWAVASALNVPEQPGRPLTDTLIDYLRPKSTLLIIDNCEHLVLAAAHLSHALLRVCPHLRILATSRQALGLTEETTWRVPPLSSPDPQHLPTLDRLKEYESVRLFEERAAAHSHKFAVTCNNRPGVALLCHRLDGLPLAIELAAVRVKVLTVEQIAARLDDRFRLLTGGSRAGLPRHQTLRATMDWSYDLLSASERALLRRLSVFAGGWALETAEAICAGDDLEMADVLDLQGQLVDKSLVTVDAQNHEVRYRLLEMVRQYARERLVAAGEASTFLTRHRDWYLALAEQADRELPGAQQQLWLQRLETEHDNLRAALIWSGTDACGAEGALRLAGALQWFWADRGYWSEAREWLDGALARAGNGPSAPAAKALQAATFFALQQGDAERATALGRKGLALCETLGDRENAAMLLTWLGNVAILQGDHARAAELLENSLEICRTVGKYWLTSMALAHLGRVVRYAGDYDRASALHRQSLALANEAEDQSLIALSLYNLGMDVLRGNDPASAAEHFRPSLAICREVGNRRITEECLKGLAGVAWAQHLPKRAACLFGAAQRLRETIGFRPPDQAYHDERAAAVRTALGQQTFEAAWAEGRAMTLEQAIEYALAEEPV